MLKILLSTRTVRQVLLYCPNQIIHTQNFQNLLSTNLMETSRLQPFQYTSVLKQHKTDGAKTLEKQ